jgi:lipoprotein-anchoring transpeptidase ErfK/SrfK
VKKSAQPSIHVSVARQQLALKRGRVIERRFPISTSKYGLGQEEGSFKTPIGRFRIATKIGAGEPTDVAFKARVPVRPSAEMLAADDLVMSRILWLDGLEPHNQNTFDRYIYIHGTNHEEQIGEPASHGCIRMRNADIAELFELVDVNTRVVIAPPKSSSRARKTPRKSLRRRIDLPK